MTVTTIERPTAGAYTVCAWCRVMGGHTPQCPLRQGDDLGPAAACCPRCGGGGRITCIGCGGSGQDPGGVPNPGTCRVCGGARTIPCTQCGAVGTVG